ncbi:MAG: hypothetical protein ACU85V_00215 [Gammaproteobacteria bacterium]
MTSYVVAPDGRQWELSVPGRTIIGTHQCQRKRRDGGLYLDPIDYNRQRAQRAWEYRARRGRRFFRKGGK